MRTPMYIIPNGKKARPPTTNSAMPAAFTAQTLRLSRFRAHGRGLVGGFNGCAQRGLGESMMSVDLWRCCWWLSGWVLMLLVR